MRSHSCDSFGSARPGARLVFIDPGIAEAAILARGVEPGHQAILLDAGRDGVRQIAHHLARHRDVAAVHIVAHGAPGEITLGTARLSARSLAEHGHVLEIWRDALDLEAELHLWCCDTAAGPTGAAFLRELGDILGVGIAAARGKVGAAWLGGGWTLDARIGEIAPALPFGPAAIAAVGSVFATTTDLVSIGVSGAKSTPIQFQGAAALSADGRFVAWTSDAPNLVANDTNGKFDAFVRDLQTDVTERVSVGTGGAEANGNSFQPVLSGDGRFVAFVSQASSLIPNQNGQTSHVLVKDRTTGEIEILDRAPNGALGDSFADTVSISANGRFVAFRSQANNLLPNDTAFNNVYVADRDTDTLQRVNLGLNGAGANGNSVQPAISGDGRFVAFTSDGTNLIANDTNGKNDIFVFDRQTGTTTRESVATGGTQADDDSFVASLSANGRFVVFSSNAANLVLGDTPVASGGFTDIFVHDRETGTTERVSVSNAGVAGNGDSTIISPNVISADGRFVTFQSFANNLVPNDTNNEADVFIFDRQTRTIDRVLDSFNGQVSRAVDPSISADGRFIGFQSGSNDLLPNDPNPGLVFDQVFVAANSGAPSVSIANASTTEGNAVGSSLVFNVTLSAASSQLISVQVNTLNGSAFAGSDYATNTATVNFQPGQTSAQFFVTVNGDTALEIDEVVLVTLSSPTGGATLNPDANSARGTIVNDDAAPSIGITGQTLNGDGANNFLVGTSGNDSINGQAGDDTEFGNEAGDVLNGGDGADFIVADFPADPFTGGGDLVDVGNGNDNVFAGGGNDTVFGGAGNDLIAGDTGNNLLFGGDGDNALFGFDGADTILGGNNGDIVFGLSGPDVIVTQGGIDLIIAGGPVDGPTDADFVDMGAGGGSVFAGSGDDTILADNGNDFVLGEDGADRISTGGGNDALIAGPGNDTLDAGAGDDVLIPEGGDDVMSGGAGADRFNYPAGIAINNDRILDFIPVDDTVQFPASLFATSAAALAAVSQVGSDAVLSFVGGTITFVGLQASALSTADFVIV